MWNPATLESWARDPDKYLRQAAAQNPSMPAAALETLALDRDTFVRWSAARNPSSLLEALRVSRLHGDFRAVSASRAKLFCEDHFLGRVR